MAPELWELKSPTVKTDLYALGCLAFELLAGTVPFPGADRAAIRSGHLSQVPPEAPCGDVVLRNLNRRLLPRPSARKTARRTPGPCWTGCAGCWYPGGGCSGSHRAWPRRARCPAGPRGSRESAAEGAVDTRRQLEAQAKADLREIVSDALSDLQAVEPVAAFGERAVAGSRFVAAASFTLTAGGVELRIDLWEGTAPSQPVPGDTSVLAGCVMITNPGYPTVLNAANLVYDEPDGGRLAWRISELPRQRSHRARPLPVRPLRAHPRPRPPRVLRPQGALLHAPPGDARRRSKTVTALTAETLLGLFQEAVDLRPPDPRTGLW